MHFFWISNAPLLSKPLSLRPGPRISGQTAAGRGRRGLSIGACGHYRPVSWCYLPFEISNPRLVRRFQFLYMRDEDLLLLFAFTFFMLLYFCLPSLYFTRDLTCVLWGWPGTPVTSCTSHAWLCTAEDKLNKLWSKKVSEYFYYSVWILLLKSASAIHTGSPLVSQQWTLHFFFHFQDKDKCGNCRNSCVCGTHHSLGVFHEATCSSSDVSECCNCVKCK